MGPRMEVVQFSLRAWRGKGYQRRPRGGVHADGARTWQLGLGAPPRRKGHESAVDEAKEPEGGAPPPGRAGG